MWESEKVVVHSGILSLHNTFIEEERTLAEELFVH